MHLVGALTRQLCPERFSGTSNGRVKCTLVRSTDAVALSCWPRCWWEQASWERPTTPPRQPPTPRLPALRQSSRRTKKSRGCRLLWRLSRSNSKRCRNRWSSSRNCSKKRWTRRMRSRRSARTWATSRAFRRWFPARHLQQWQFHLWPRPVPRQPRQRPVAIPARQARKATQSRRICGWAVSASCQSASWI